MERAMGAPIERPPEEATNVELEEWGQKIMRGILDTTFTELSIKNEVFWQRAAMQHLREVQKIENPEGGKEDVGKRELDTLEKSNLQKHKRELIAANQLITYNQYLPEVIQEVITFTELYKNEFQEMLPSLPQADRTKLLQEYRQAVEYLFVLKKAMDERRNYANARLLDKRIREIQVFLHFNLTEEERKIYTQAGRTPPSGYTEEEWEHILSDEEIPANLTAEERENALKEREQSLRNSRQATYDMLPPRSREKLDELTQIFTAAQKLSKAEEAKERGRYYKEDTLHAAVLDNRLLEILKGNPKGQEDLGTPQNFLPQLLYINAIELRYTQLQQLQTQIARKETKEWSAAEKKEAQEYLSKERTKYMEDLIAVTQQLATYQQKMAELTVIQHQFGDTYNLMGVRAAPKGVAPQEVVDLIDKSMDGARDFHLQRIQAMLSRINTEFDPHSLGNLQDAAVMKMTETINRLSGFIRNMVTSLSPENDMKKYVDGVIDKTFPLAIQESLRSGVDAEGNPMTVEEKLKRIGDVITRFQNTRAVEKYSNTVALIQNMPDASTYVGQEIEMPLPATPKDIRTNAEVTALLKEHNGATVYALLLRQMRQDSEIFSKEYKAFLEDMEKLVNIRLGLVAEVIEIKDSWKALATALSASAGIATAATVISALAGSGLALRLGIKGTRAFFRLPGSLFGKLRNAPGALVGGVKRVPELVGRAGGTALLGYKSYTEFRDLVEMDESISEQHKRIIAQLKGVGFEEYPQGQEAVLRYNDRGVNVVVSVGELNQVQQAKEVAQALRAGVTATEALAVLSFGVRRVVPYAIVAEVIIEGIRFGKNQQANREFVDKAPAWLLAKINLAEVIKESSYEILTAESGERMTDGPGGEANEELYQQPMREKMLFSMLHAELREFPELRNEFYEGSEHPVNLEHFYAGSGGFKDVFLPAFYSRLYERSSKGLTWEEVRKGQVDRDYGIPLPSSANISKVEIRRAMREAIVFYLQHKREERYLSALRERDGVENKLKTLPITEEAEKQKLEMHREILEDIVSTLGEAKVFGTQLQHTNIDALRKNGGETRAELIAKRLFQGVKNAKFQVPKGQVPGLQKDFSFGEYGSLYKQTIDDIALRYQLTDVIPQTMDEPETSVENSDSWPFRLSDAENAALVAANFVAKKAGLPLLDATNAREQAKAYITKAAALLATKNTSEQYTKETDSSNTFIRYNKLGEERVQNKIQQLKEPALRGEMIAPENRVATFFDVETCAGDNIVVLATYVYYDPRSASLYQPQFFVVQKAITEFAAERVSGPGYATGYMHGSEQVESGVDFLRTQNGSNAYALLKNRLEERWKEDRTYDAKRKEMERHQGWEKEEAKKKPNTWLEYPNRYVDQSQGEKRYEYVSYQVPEGHKEGYFCYLRTPQVNTGPSIGPAPETAIAKTIGERHATRLDVTDEAGNLLYSGPVHADYVMKIGKSKSRFPSAVLTAALTTPLPTKDLESIRNVLAVYVQNLNEDVNRMRENVILQLYKKLQPRDHRAFLQKFERVLRTRTQNGKKPLDQETLRTVLLLMQAEEKR
ncbi:hypothetical protein COU76_04925 [Candidatus Peregrinibacteria bacterium CG10_big_fil_rev_8_21_14_0_10_49_10]|nr:MAG: hypothetical protein COU76_04925 [Candidatus Peregrinibacteria bacterium CG10_big_fil_rev_8_21_14_0_10_49_10]